MSEVRKRVGGREFVCPYCRVRVSAGSAYCPRCGVRFRSGGWEVEVSGSDAEDVDAVSRALVDKFAEQKQFPVHRNPWISGSFYLSALVILVTLFLVVAKTVAVAVLPVVVLGALLSVSLIGAFQLRQDQSLSEKNFLSLMALTFRQIPLLRSRQSGTAPKKLAK